MLETLAGFPVVWQQFGKVPAVVAVINWYSGQDIREPLPWIDITGLAASVQ